MAFSRLHRFQATQFLFGSTTIVVALFFLSGCGLEEYEKRMQEHKKRIDYLTAEADKVAEYQLVWNGDPKKNKEDIEPSELSYRPPKGVSEQPDAKLSRPGVAMYPGPSGGPIREVWVAVKRGANPESFAKSVRDQLKVTSADRKPYSAGPKSALVNYERISEKKKGSNPTGNFDLFFLKKPGDIQTAIGFKYDDTKDIGAVEGAMNLSLGTLRVGADAANPPRPYIPPSSKKKAAATGK